LGGKSLDSPCYLPAPATKRAYCTFLGGYAETPKMAQYKWLTASDDAYPGAHDNPPLGVDTIGVLADDMRKVSTVVNASEI